MTNDLTLSNQYALHALRERRATIAGELVSVESRVRYLRSALVHLDGTLALMDPSRDPKDIKAKRPYKRVKLFGAGKLNGMILDALRRGGRPMTTQEVIASVAEATQFGPEAAAGLKGRVRSNLLYLTSVRGLVVKEGERESAKWSIQRGVFDRKEGGD